MLVRLLEALRRSDRLDLQVSMQLPPAMVRATWTDARTGKARYACVRVDPEFLANADAHGVFIEDVVRVLEHTEGHA